MTMTTHGFLDFENWGPLESGLKDKFLANTRWPIDRAALTALVDLGMSDAAIADYFGVTAANVAEVRQAYRL